VKEINPPEDVIKAMTKIIEADRTKKAMVTEAEGKKQAQILEAEGLKMAKFLEAEALERLGEAQTHVIIKLAEEIGDPKLASLVFIGNEYVEALKDMAKENNSKLIILPPNTSSILDLVTSLQPKKEGSS
jgi:regulator of protease activity HflC (stomatin/prohibitin superfamily)